MSNERKEPTYLFTDRQVADKSEIARRFLETRTRLNENVDKADNFLVKRFYNIDHNTYLEGAIPAKYKELMGLVVSAGLRCDDCIQYHIIQSYRLGAARPEQEEALNVALACIIHQHEIVSRRSVGSEGERWEESQIGI